VKSLALIYQVPILVFEYCSSFDHYVVVDAAIYGNGSLNSKIVYLIHTDKNSFDYLVLTNIGNEKAHEIYKRIYDKEFAEPTEYRRAGSFFDDDNQSKCSSHMDSSASDVSKGQTDGSGSDSESAISDDQRSPTPDDSHISDESGALHGSEMVIPLIRSATLMFLANQCTVCFLSPTR